MIAELEKICTRCPDRGPQPVENFRVRGTGRRSWCRECEKADTNARMIADRAKPDGNYARKRVAQYGLSWDEYLTILDEQEYGCASCGDELTGKHKAHIDHCHVTGQVRGVLCRSCNIALGLLQDDPERVTSLLNYIERNANGSGRS